MLLAKFGAFIIWPVEFVRSRIPGSYLYLTMYYHADSIQEHFSFLSDENRSSFSEYWLKFQESGWSAQ